MSKFAPLRRSKSEQDISETSNVSSEKTYNGVRLLVHLAEGDLPVLDFLNDFIQEFLDTDFKGNGEFYIRTHQCLSKLEQLYRSKTSLCPYYLLSFFRHIVTLFSETLFLSASSDVCRFAIETTVVTSPNVKVKLRDVCHNVHEIQNSTVKLELIIMKHLQSAGNADFQLTQLDSKSIITQTENIWRQIRRCETPMKDVMSAVESKARLDQTFFQRASLGIGAVCAGRFLWSLWQGGDQQSVINAGLWSLGTGISGAVLQIPRARATRILEQLRQQKTKKREMQDLVRHWLIESDEFCAKLVLISSSKSKFS